MPKSKPAKPQKPLDQAYTFEEAVLHKYPSMWEEAHFDFWNNVRRMHQRKLPPEMIREAAFAWQHTLFTQRPMDWIRSLKKKTNWLTELYEVISEIAYDVDEKIKTLDQTRPFPKEIQGPNASPQSVGDTHWTLIAQMADEAFKQEQYEWLAVMLGRGLKNQSMEWIWSYLIEGEGEKLLPLLEKPYVSMGYYLENLNADFEDWDYYLNNTDWKTLTPMKLNEWFNQSSISDAFHMNWIGWCLVHQHFDVVLQELPRIQTYNRDDHRSWKDMMLERLMYSDEGEVTQKILVKRPDLSQAIYGSIIRHPSVTRPFIRELLESTLRGDDICLGRALRHHPYAPELDTVESWEKYGQKEGSDPAKSFLNHLRSWVEQEKLEKLLEESQEQTLSLTKAKVKNRL